MSFALMSGKKNPRAAQLIGKAFIRRFGQCDACDVSKSIYWHHNDQIACDMSVSQQRALVAKYGQQQLYVELTAAFEDLFGKDEQDERAT
jgi:hypothetical protein